MNSSSGSASLISNTQSKLDMLEYKFDSIEFQIEAKYKFFYNHPDTNGYFVLLILTRQNYCYFS